MKTLRFSVLLTLFFVSTLTFAQQDHPQWHLPEGAKARLGNGRTIGAIAFSPDGTRLAVGSTTGIWIYDAKTHQALTLLTGKHRGNVSSVAFSPDSAKLASGSYDGTALLWELSPAPPEPEETPEDLNDDGAVNIQDLVLVASNFGKTGENDVDVNGDGVINIQDLVKIAAAIGS